MEEAGTEEGEKNPEWGDSKSVLSISQLNHNLLEHLESGCGQTVWLPPGS